MDEKIMDINEVLKHLPQRPPFLFLDKIIDVVPGESLAAIKNVSINEPYFAGHFPGKPVMPGVLILEALAQAATALAFLSTDEKPEDGSLYFFAGIDNARFKRIVIPGDQLRLEVKLLKIRKSFWKLEGIASVGGEIACTAELMSARKEAENND